MVGNFAWLSSIYASAETTIDKHHRLLHARPGTICALHLASIRPTTQAGGAADDKQIYGSTLRVGAREEFASA